MSDIGLNYRRKSFLPQIFRTLTIALLFVAVAFSLYKGFTILKETFVSREMYVGSDEARIQLIEDFSTLSLSLVDVPRGAKITTYGMGKNIDVSNEKFYQILYVDEMGNEIQGYMNAINIVEDYSDVIFEENVYANANTYISNDDSFLELNGGVGKGEKFSISDWELNQDGYIIWYKLYNSRIAGYASGKYFTTNIDEAKLDYDINKYFEKRDLLHLDFRDRDKNDFENNPVISDARSWYINYNNLTDIDVFIEEASKTNINTFIIDVKVSEGVSFESEVTNKRAGETKNLTNFNKQHLIDIVKHLNELGYYTIARIEVFKDQGYAKTNSESVIKYLDTQLDFKDSQGNVFLSPYSKDVWSYNLEFALEVTEIGFNEVLLDNVRFPNVRAKIDDNLDFSVDSELSKEETIQQFSMYIYDQLSLKEVYVSSTVLGQVAFYDKADGLRHGQQWHAMSNVYDYIYPYMFVEEYTSSYLSGKSPFKYQYDLIYLLNTEVNKLNSILGGSGSKVRPIIQCYNNWGYYDWVNIDAKHLERQIQAIYDNGNKGFVAWSKNATIEKYLYDDRIEAFKIEYVKKDYSGSFQ